MIGIIDYGNGYRYEGDIVDGISNGIGFLTTPNGYYLGHFLNGRLHGDGELGLNGVIYTGRFDNGHIYGKGSIVNGNKRYNGNFVKLFRNKYGTEGGLVEECPVCLEDTKLTILRKCKHRVCASCLSQFVKRCCPMCRKGF